MALLEVATLTDFLCFVFPFGRLTHTARARCTTDTFLAEEANFGQPSQLLQMLSDNKVTHLYFAGMNSERSVQFSALEACLLLQNTMVYIVEDACRGSNQAAAMEGFKKVRTALPPLLLA